MPKFNQLNGSRAIRNGSHAASRCSGQDEESGDGAQPKARATRLEQSRTKPPAVNARKLSDTRSWLCMGHLPLLSSMLRRID